MNNADKPLIILGIESSCDDTSAAVLKDGKILANIVAGQKVHEQYGGVVPELASRAHMQNIVPVVGVALQKAGIRVSDLTAIAFTSGPGLLGSLLVGTGFAKGLSLGLDIPLVEVNHMQAHILAHFIKNAPEQPVPRFPFICLTVSGGHTQIVLVKDFFDMEIVGETIDDAAGEAFDKAAKVLGLPYPGGPLIDKLASGGDMKKFKFPRPKAEGYHFSFSGLKTSLLYFIRDNSLEEPDFVAQNMADICASYQFAIVDYLMNRLEAAATAYGIKDIALAGGVSANSYLRKRFEESGKRHDLGVFIPPFEFCTDNAAMIAITGHYKYLKGDLAGQQVKATARKPLSEK